MDVLIEFWKIVDIGSLPEDSIRTDILAYLDKIVEYQQQNKQMKGILVSVLSLAQKADTSLRQDVWIQTLGFIIEIIKESLQGGESGNDTAGT